VTAAQKEAPVPALEKELGIAAEKSGEEAIRSPICGARLVPLGREARTRWAPQAGRPQETQILLSARFEAPSGRLAPRSSEEPLSPLRRYAKAVKILDAAASSYKPRPKDVRELGPSFPKRHLP